MKKLAISMILITSLCFTGCGNNNAKTDITVDSDPTVVENYKITNADDALDILKAGNDRFINNNSQQKNITSERRKQLTDSQSPYAVILTCSDSRISPNIVFNAGLGEIFEVAVAGNITDDEILGSVEYAAEHLSTPLIVVMGHESCGAVTAEYNAVHNGEEVHGNIEELVSKIKPSVEGSSSIDEAARKNVQYSVNQIKNDPVIAELISHKKVKVIGAYYTLDGKVTFDE